MVKDKVALPLFNRDDTPAKVYSHWYWNSFRGSILLSTESVEYTLYRNPGL